MFQKGLLFEEGLNKREAEPVGGMEILQTKFKQF
jgi:hypothetical protein